MKYLFDEWDRLKIDLKERAVFLFLDYDGTLTPIVETPRKANISPETKELLKKLLANSQCKIAIISGRALKDIKSKVGLKKIIYAGNHGLEIEGPKIKFESQISPRLKSIIRHINDELAHKLSTIKGALVEDKGLTISVHYRLVDEKGLLSLQNILAEITNPYIVRDKIKVNFGKKVYEIKPPLIWGKDKAVLWLLARQKFAKGAAEVVPVYLGDDATDEDAFKALRHVGITIFVGKPKTSFAKYYLNNAVEVRRFLKKVFEIQKGRL